MQKKHKIWIIGIMVIVAAVIAAAVAGVAVYQSIAKQDDNKAAMVVKRMEEPTLVPVTTYTPKPSEEQDVSPSGEEGQAVPQDSFQPQERQDVQDSNTGVLNSSVKICIDAGHGITQKRGKEAVSPGSTEQKAAHVSGAQGAHITEEAFNLKVAQKLQGILMGKGYTVTMTRTGQECDLSNIDRANLGNESDFVVRIHADGSDNTSANGISVLIPEKSYYGDEQMVADSKRLGEAILENAVAATGARNRGTVVRGDMTGFNWSKVPVALIECGFLSNPQEEEKLAADAYQQKLAEGIASGIEAYLG